MKTRILALMAYVVLIGTQVYAGNGDLVVDGNVGIGTQNPLSKLDVIGVVRLHNFGSLSSERSPANMFTNLFLGGSLVYKGDGTYTVITDGGSNYFAGIKMDNAGGNAGAIKFYTRPSVGNSNYILTDGDLEKYVKMSIIGNNIGIGTTTPNRLLHVNSGNGNNIGIGSFNAGADANGNQQELLLGYNSINDYAIIQGHHANVVFTNLILEPNGGNVGIGTTTPGSYKLYVAGTSYATGTWQSSDLKYKKNIRPISSALDKLIATSGVSFDWKIDEYKDKGFPENRHYGVIAQEIEKILPEVVTTGPDGTKAVAYTEIIPVLIEAIKEQQKIIENQQKEIIAIKKQMKLQ